MLDMCASAIGVVASLSGQAISKIVDNGYYDQAKLEHIEVLSSEAITGYISDESKDKLDMGAAPERMSDARVLFTTAELADKDRIDFDGSQWRVESLQDYREAGYTRALIMRVRQDA